MKTAHRNAGRLLHLINQVMDLSRFDARMMRLQPQRQDLIPFLKNIFYSFETAFEARGIPLQFESRFAHLDIDFDPAKLEQVFYNLLSNALKFAAGARGGPVVLRVALLRGEQPQPGEAAVQMVSIFLTDQGPGIAEEDLAHVFDRFYQANDGSGSGSGIGLALAREIVRLHGGEITVASTLGMGTTFAIRLPVCQDGAQTGGFAATPGGGYPLPETAAMVAEGSLPLSQDGEQVILIVEDNPEMGLFLSR
ncbi:MAG: HAMP domain-containing histidine kinase, partial [Calditrichaeota bacterium]|nr:HAMP domain-containing histidine kinase [Calditrichota bacterium]